MKIKQFTRVFLGVALAFGLAAGQAQAVPTPYKVSGTFNDGGSLTGTLEIDSSAFFVGFISNWNLTTIGGSSGITGATYDSSNSSIGFFGLQNTANQTVLFSGNIFGSNRTLELANYTPTLNVASPSYAIGSIIETQKTVSGGFFNRKTTTVTNLGSGNANNPVATPEPASLILFGSGLAALGYWRYRKNKSAYA